MLHGNMTHRSEVTLRCFTVRKGKAIIYKKHFCKNESILYLSFGIIA